EVDAACILDANRLAFTRDGTLPLASSRILAQTPLYDHCNFTSFADGPQALIQRFTQLLFGMSYADPEVRRLFDLEGLTAWLPGRVTGYLQLHEAVERFGTIDSFVRHLQSRCAEDYCRPALT